MHHSSWRVLARLRGVDEKQVLTVPQSGRFLRGWAEGYSWFRAVGDGDATWALAPGRGLVDMRRPRCNARRGELFMDCCRGRSWSRPRAHAMPSIAGVSGQCFGPDAVRAGIFLEIECCRSSIAAPCLCGLDTRIRVESSHGHVLRNSGMDGFGELCCATVGVIFMCIEGRRLSGRGVVHVQWRCAWLGAEARVQGCACLTYCIRWGGILAVPGTTWQCLF